MTKIIAHRGASGSAPENTRSSFIQALEVGVDGVEFDVQMTKDGQLVVIHDETVDRTTNGQGKVKDLTLSDIKKLDAGSFFSLKYAGERILTLEETLEITRGFDLINIEIKDGFILYPFIEEKVLEKIYQFGLQEKVLISSFNHYSLKKIIDEAPGIKTGILYMAGMYNPWEYARKLGVNAIHPYYQGVFPQIVRGCHKHQLEVNIFTVNNLQDFKRYTEMDVDHIITNFPEKFKKIT